MTVREQTQMIERETLSEFASLSENNLSRQKMETPCPMRTEYQRDRDRIIHSKSFRRLKQKTQVFLSPEGDHYRTRLTHTLEVNQIARTIARSLRLNEDLTEAIALGHDLGHTPFGHAGESVLNGLYSGGFKHNLQSKRVVEKIEKNLQGLNLTREVIDGIANHTSSGNPMTLEGNIVQYADRIAYMNHDIEDAITAGVLKNSDLPKSVIEVLGDTKSTRITTLIVDIYNTSKGKNIVTLSEEVKKEYLLLHKFMFQNVYLDKKAKQEEYKVEKLITELYEYYQKNIDKMPDLYKTIAENEGEERAIVDYISGMSDDFACKTFETIFVPKKWQGLI